MYKETLLVGGDSNGIVYFWNLSKNLLENQIEFKKLKILHIKFLTRDPLRLFILDSEGVFYILE